MKWFYFNDEIEKIEVQVFQTENKHALEELQKKSHNMHKNACEGIWFCENFEGIFCALPTDLMHAFLHGIIPCHYNNYCLTHTLVDSILVSI